MRNKLVHTHMPQIYMHRLGLVLRNPDPGQDRFKIFELKFDHFSETLFNF